MSNWRDAVQKALGRPGRFSEVNFRKTSPVTPPETRANAGAEAKPEVYSVYPVYPGPSDTRPDEPTKTPESREVIFEETSNNLPSDPDESIFEPQTTIVDEVVSVYPGSSIYTFSNKLLLIGDDIDDGLNQECLSGHVSTVERRVDPDKLDKPNKPQNGFEGGLVEPDPPHPVDGVLSSLFRELMTLMMQGEQFTDAAVLDVLSAIKVEVQERAAIVEVDGCLSRHDAEQLAIEEFTSEWNSSVIPSDRPNHDQELYRSTFQEVISRVMLP